MFLTHEEYINVYIVQQDGREGYLFQTIDYGEFSFDSPISGEKLKCFKRDFPQLKYTPCSQGMMISKKEYNPKDLESDKELARILSFCCALEHAEHSDSDSESDTDASYSFDVIVSLSNGKKITLISNICNTGDDVCENKTRCLANRLKEILMSIPKDSRISMPDISDVSFVRHTHYMEDYYIKLLSDTNRTDWTIRNDEMTNLENFLYNLGFSEVIQDYLSDGFQFNNPVHRGILIGILTQSKYNVLEPFLPLQEHPNEMKQVDAQTAKWEQLLLYTLKSTEIN
jgi:hypothetical protein